MNDAGFIMVASGAALLLIAILAGIAAGIDDLIRYRRYRAGRSRLRRIGMWP